MSLKAMLSLKVVPDKTMSQSTGLRNPVLLNALTSASINSAAVNSASANSILHEESKTSFKQRVGQQRQNLTSAWHCLIVSNCSQRREVIGQSAFAGGWITLSSENASDALKHLCRNLVKMVIIDLQENNFDKPELLKLSEHVMWAGGMLLVTIGDSTTGRVESWARQLGVWSYLPGINAESDLSLLCSQGLEVTEKMNRPVLS